MSAQLHRKTKRPSHHHPFPPTSSSYIHHSPTSAPLPFLLKCQLPVEQQIVEDIPEFPTRLDVNAGPLGWAGGAEAFSAGFEEAH